MKQEPKKKQAALRLSEKEKMDVTKQVMKRKKELSPEAFEEYEKKMKELMDRLVEQGK